MSKVELVYHPGSEAQPDTGSSNASWNNKAGHTRKFMNQPGDYVDSAGELQTNIPLCFWGEWEAQAKVIYQPGTVRKNMPSYVYEPYFDRGYTGERKHNTDPYVFGKAMRYVTRLQTQSKKTSASTELARLEPGSVILFGSLVTGQFTLDMVFVVADYVTYTQETFPALYKHERIVNDGVYQLTALEPMRINSRQKNPASNACLLSDAEQRLYFGATYEERDQFGGMYSFAPCQPVSANGVYSSLFARPVVTLDGLIGKKSTQNYKELYAGGDLAHTQQIWQQAKTEIEQQGLLAGVRFATPSIR